MPFPIIHRWLGLAQQRGKDKERFLEVLERTKERYGYLLHAYTLMDNHYHLLMETPGQTYPG